jgi:hypothetical protein
VEVRGFEPLASFVRVGPAHRCANRHSGRTLETVGQSKGFCRKGLGLGSVAIP